MVKRNPLIGASGSGREFRSVSSLAPRAPKADALWNAPKMSAVPEILEVPSPATAASDEPFSLIESKKTEMNDRIYDEFCRGGDPKELAKKFGRALASIYRIVGARRAAKIFELPLEYVPSPEFERAFGAPSEEDKILRFRPEISVSGFEPADASAIVRNFRKTSKNDATPVASSYWTRIDDVPLLTAKEESFLFRKFNFLKFKAKKLRDALDPKRPKMSLIGEIERLWREAVATKKRIVSANLRLVVSVAKKYAGGSTGFSDLVGDGNVSLMKAVEKFDYSTGNRFSTYATWALYRNFARSIPDERKQIERFRAADVALLELRQDYRTSPRQAERVYCERTRQVARFMSELNDREREIIELRYGFGANAKPQTLRQVGEDMGVTKERVRQIEIRALAKLRKIAQEEKIEMPEI